MSKSKFGFKWTKSESTYIIVAKINHKNNMYLSALTFVNIFIICVFVYLVYYLPIISPSLFMGCVQDSVGPFTRVTITIQELMIHHTQQIKELRQEWKTIKTVTNHTIKCQVIFFAFAYYWNKCNNLFSYLYDSLNALPNISIPGLIMTLWHRNCNIIEANI